MTEEDYQEKELSKLTQGAEDLQVSNLPNQGDNSSSSKSTSQQRASTIEASIKATISIETEPSSSSSSNLKIDNVLISDKNNTISSCQRPPRRPEKDLREAAEMVAQGTTFQVASEKYDIPISTIRFYMVRKGLLRYNGSGSLEEYSPPNSPIEPEII